MVENRDRRDLLLMENLKLMAAKEATDIDLQLSRDDPTSAANIPIKLACFVLKYYVRCVFQMNDRLVEKDHDYSMREALTLLGSVLLYGYYFNNMTTYSETQILYKQYTT